MTPDDAFTLTRDVLAAQLFAVARAQSLIISVGQLTGMAETALEASGFRALIEVVQAGDAAAMAYADTYTEIPEEVSDTDTSWRASRGRIHDYPNLAGLLTVLP